MLKYYNPFAYRYINNVQFRFVILLSDYKHAHVCYS